MSVPYFQPRHAVMQVQLPISPTRLEELCYSDLSTTKAERNAVVNSLLQALHQLESSVDMDSNLRNVIVGEGGDWMGQYMIKREYSEGSFHVFGIIVPDLRSNHASKDLRADHYCSEAACQNNITSSSSGGGDDTSDRGGPVVKPLQAHQPVDSLSVAFNSGSADAEADDEAGDEAGEADQHTTANDADLGMLGAVTGICVGTEYDEPIIKAVAFMHKAQALIWGLVPQRIAQLRPIARLLGMDSCSSSSSISSGCNSSSDAIPQAAFCPNVDSQTEFGDSTDASRAQPD